MKTFPLRVLAPERTFFDGACTSLTVPSIDGMYGLMAQHEDIVLAIVPGKLTLRDADGVEQIAAVSEGVLKMERGDTLAVALSVWYACPLPVSEIRIVIAAPASGRKPQELTVATVPFVQRNYRHMINCPHRGDFEAGVVRLTVTDMFGLFVLSRRESRKLVKVEVRPKITNTAPLILKPVEAGRSTPMLAPRVPIMPVL